MRPVGYRVQGEGETWGTGVAPAHGTSTLAVVHLSLVQLKPQTERLLYTMPYCAGRCAFPPGLFPNGWEQLLAHRD